MYLCFQIWTLERVNYSSVHIKGTVSYRSFSPDWDNTIKRSPEKILQKIQRSNKNWHAPEEKRGMRIWAIYESMSPYPTSVKGCGTFPSYHSHGLRRGSKKPKKYHIFLKAEAVPLDLLRRYGMWCRPYNVQMQRKCKHVRCCPSQFSRKDMWNVS